MTADQAADGPDRENPSPLEPVPMEPVPPPERRTRAGRNLPAAVGVGLALAALILLALYVWKPAFLGVIVVAIVLALWELTNALRGGQVRVPIVPVAVGAVALTSSAYAGGSEPLLVALTL